jgi:hypothetical protein
MLRLLQINQDKMYQPCAQQSVFAGAVMWVHEPFQSFEKHSVYVNHFFGGIVEVYTKAYLGVFKNFK